MAVRVEPKPNEPMDKVLRRFKKMLDREGISRDMRKYTQYEKPSEGRKRMKREREKERAKAVRAVQRKKYKARKARARSLKRLVSQDSIELHNIDLTDVIDTPETDVTE